MTLLDLPLEIQRLIFEEYHPTHLHRCDLASLRTTCSTMRNLVSPILFADLKFDITMKTFRQLLSFLDEVASSSTAIAKYVRCLEITSLNCRYGADVEYGDRRGVRIGQKFLFVEFTILDQANEALRGVLGAAVAKFNGLHSLRWKITDLDEDWALEDVSNAVASIGSLKELEIRANLYTSRPLSSISLERFSELEYISIQNYCLFCSQVLKSVRNLIGRSPKLSRFEVPAPSFMCLEDGHDLRANTPRPKNYTLSYLLGGASISPPLPLTHLSLSDIHMWSDALSLPHLTSLKSLRLSWHSAAGSDIDAYLWRGLILGSVHLHHLTFIGEMTTGLMLYLPSFSGLRHLYLSLGRITGTMTLEMDERLATEFWTCVLPTHKSTLQHLRVFSRGYNRAWHYRAKYSDSLRQCVALEELTVLIGWVTSTNVSEGTSIHDFDVAGLIMSCHSSRLRRLHCSFPMGRENSMSSSTIAEKVEDQLFGLKFSEEEAIQLPDEVVFVTSAELSRRAGDVYIMAIMDRKKDGTNVYGYKKRELNVR